MKKRTDIANEKQALARLDKGKEAANAVISVLKNVSNK